MSRAGLLVVALSRCSWWGPLQRVPCPGTVGEVMRSEVRGKVCSWGRSISSPPRDQVLPSQHNLPLTVVFFPHCCVQNWEAPFLSKKIWWCKKEVKKMHMYFTNRNSVLTSFLFQAAQLYCTYLCCACISVALWTNLIRWPIFSVIFFCFLKPLSLLISCMYVWYQIQTYLQSVNHRITEC